MNLKIRHFYLTSKPYSYISEISCGILFYFILNPFSKSNSLFLIIIQTLSMWLYFNWQSDKIQRDSGRLPPSAVLVGTPLIISIIIGFYLGGILGILGVVFYAFTICLYALKALKSWAGPIGPIFRIFTIIGHYISIWSLSPTLLTTKSIIIIILICIWKGVRNLIGDVRDIQNDVHELPAKYGAVLSLWIIRLGLFISILLVIKISVWSTFYITLIAWLFLELFQYYFIEPYKWGYITHRIFILITVIIQLIYAQIYGLHTLWSIFLFILALLFNSTYSKLPGKNFLNLKNLFAVK